MIWRFYRHKSLLTQCTQKYSPQDLPVVTVQLPIFNEMYVAGRLLDAIAQLKYPRAKLEIQVLDDSSDETQQICQAKVAQLQAKGINIRYIHRSQRQGFKAGALAAGLQSAMGEFVLIFDADFIPTPDLLDQMVHYFTDPKIGMVQARWVHLNREYSLLTEIQALMLDAHFMIEQTARNRAGCFFNFNGTAGMWRVQTIHDAGGWQHTTVTEDLDLSYRVQLQGWRCLYLPDVIVPAELPMEMNAFKSQQFRWAKGASQVAKKLLFDVFGAELPLHIKFEAFLHLTNNFNYCLLLILLLLSFPYQQYISLHHWTYSLLIYVPIFLGTTLSLCGFYWVSQYEQGRPTSIWRFGYRIFWLMSIGTGLSLSQSLAVCDGLLRVDTDFVRTPKHGVIHKSEHWFTRKYRGNKNWIIVLEGWMLFYLLTTVRFAVDHAHYLSLPFLIIFVTGYIYVLGLGIFQSYFSHLSGAEKL
ncbi:MAG: glycosyltransferase [Spirulinaceae cyanobacterium]